MPRIVCTEKNCIYCKKPQFDENGNFKFGSCKPRNNVLVLRSDIKYVPNIVCRSFEPRKRKIKY